MGAGNKNEDGFTLVEMLIAMFIFSLISVGSMAALTGGLRGKEQIAARMDAAASNDTARALIKADLDHLILYPARDPLGTPEPYQLAGGDNNLMAFTRTGRANPGALEARGDLQRVEYRFTDGAIIRRALASANPAPDVAVIERVLYDDVQSAEMKFMMTPNARFTQVGAGVVVQGSAISTSVLGGVVITLDQIQILNPPQANPLVLRYVTLTITFMDGQVLTQNFEVPL